MRFAVIIATKGRPDVLRDALESFAACAPAGTRAIVVDGDPARTAAPVVSDFQRRHADRAVLYLPSRPGLPLQRNAGIDATDAATDVLVFMDDDATLQPGAFAALERAYEDPSVVGVTGLVTEDRTARVGSDRRLRRLVVGGGRQGTMTSFGFRREIVDLDREHDVEYMGGAFMTARRAPAAQVRFDEGLGGYALGEDDDFSYRLSRRGRMRWLPVHMAVHAATGVQTSDPRAFNRLVVINRTYLFRKNFAGSARAWLGFGGLLLVLAAHRVLNREWSGLRGLFDGLVEVCQRGAGGSRRDG